jgi:phosphoribosyl-dephospho-CoA transferase
MLSPCSRGSGALRRHDLAFVSPLAWRAVLENRRDLAQEPLVADWVDRGWPLIVRRRAPGDAIGVPLGLPLPPSHGKRRLACVLPLDGILSTAPALAVDAAIDVAPPAWRSTMLRLIDLAGEFGGQARLYGSLAWRALTGLDYVTPRSDLDVLLPLPRANDVARLTGALAALECVAAMRLDGELVRGDGAGVNWRELHDGGPDVLVKTIDATALLRTRHFIGAEIRS